MAKEIAEEYASSLADLTVNSKPLINMLTILAEENIDHAGVIVETVEKHLEKVPPEIKLPVLYLVDSIIKNVGGAYTQKFSQSIVNMFTRTFKQVDEKIRSQMFKLRETWHDVFPAMKLYQLDVKVSLIDPAWPIQAQPQQLNIHVNPNFLKKNTAAATSTTPAPTDEEEKMRTILAKKEQELLMLQRKKIEMELEQTRRQLELAEKGVKKVPPVTTAATPIAMVNPVVAPALAPEVPPATLPAKARLGPPVNKSAGAGRIAPVSAALISARRDPRLARMQPTSIIPPVGRPTVPPPPSNIPRVSVPAAAPSPPTIPRVSVPAVPPPPNIPRVSMPAVPPPPPVISPNVFDIKPLERVTKRKNVITIDVNPETARTAVRDPRRRRDPRLETKQDPKPRRDKNRIREERIEEKRKRDTDKEQKREDKEGKRLEEERKRLDEERKRLDECERIKDKINNINKIERKKEEIRRFDDNKDRVSEEKVIEKNEKNSIDEYIDKLVDPKKINKLPPIPKINRDEVKDIKEKDAPSPVKRRKEIKPDKKKKRDNNNSSKDSSSGSSPEKRAKSKESRKVKPVEPPVEVEEKPPEPEVVPFKELKNYHKERYMRRNREKSESPETVLPEKMDIDKPAENESTNAPEVVMESKDVDLRVLPAVEKAAPVAQKRPSTETVEGKTKKNRLDKFDILFGNEDVDLRQLPQVEEIVPPPRIISEPPKQKQEEIQDVKPEEMESPGSPVMSPKRDWNEVKVREKKEDTNKTPSKLDLVRAKLAEATKGKDRLGRPLLFSKEASVERERRRTISSEDTDLRLEAVEEFDAEDHKKTINIIMTQAKEQFSDGQLDKNQYNALMYQVLQLNEKLKLKEAKQRESLELSKRKLKTHIQNENKKISVPKSSPNTFGDIDERVTPAVFIETPQENQGFMKDSDMRMNMETVDGPRPVLLPGPPMPPFMPYPNWRGQPMPRMDEFMNMPRRFRGPVPPFYRGNFDKLGPRQFGPLGPGPIPLPTPKIGMCQEECPLKPYERSESPPPLGTPGVIIPPTDFNVLEYIDQDPVKTIQIDGVPREIRFYGETGVIMLDWDDPREIKFLPGCRRVTFDNKDSIVLSFNEPYKQVEIDDQVFDIRFGAPTRELYINGRWFECFFGGQPFGVMIDGKPRLVHLEGPLPQVDIGKTKRTDLVAGKINLIVNATQVCPVYLDAKVQKIFINGQYYTLRFVDALRTVLINEQPFRVEYGDLPKPITINNEKFFIRFSALPRNVKPGYVQIANMQGASQPTPPYTGLLAPVEKMEVDQEPIVRPPKTPSPEGDTQGLDMLASVIPSNLDTPASASAYCLAEPLFSKTDKIPGLETSPDKEEKPSLPILGNINVTDLFAKLVATGIVAMPGDKKDEPKENAKEVKPKEDKSVVHKVDLLKSGSLRVKQPAVVGKLYGGMQCSGCGARFPPEHTVRYSQHLDWHFRQNRRERDSARRAHSRHWYYDLADWLQYEEVDELPEREKSWFETVGNAEENSPPAPPPEEAPSVAAGAPADCHCALCGDRFHQFYNEDKEEWHLKNSVKFEDKNYHPICFEDYKASLSKDEPKPETTDEVVAIVDKGDDDEAILIKDGDDADTNSQSDNESVVEVVEDEQQVPEPVEIVEAEDEGDEDDVVLKAEPVEQVVVQDDADTDDETTAQRADRDKQAAIDFANIKIKQEPIDPDDEPEITAEEEPVTTTSTADTTHTTVLSSIDGNVQLQSTAPAVALPTGGIRINISKTITTPIPTFVSTAQDDMFEDISADDEPLPPGEEPELEYTLKPSLEGVQLSRQPPVKKGNELSGLCSIM